MNPVAYEQTQQAQYTVPPQPYTPQQQYDPPPQNYVQQSAPEPYQGIEVQQNQTYTQVPGQHYGWSGSPMISCGILYLMYRAKVGWGILTRYLSCINEI